LPSAGRAFVAPTAPAAPAAQAALPAPAQPVHVVHCKFCNTPNGIYQHHYTPATDVPAGFVCGNVGCGRFMALQARH